MRGEMATTLSTQTRVDNFDVIVGTSKILNQFILVVLSYLQFESFSSVQHLTVSF